MPHQLKYVMWWRENKRNGENDCERDWSTNLNDNS